MNRHEELEHHIEDMIDYTKRMWDEFLEMYDNPAVRLLRRVNEAWVDVAKSDPIAFKDQLFCDLDCYFSDNNIEDSEDQTYITDKVFDYFGKEWD